MNFLTASIVLNIAALFDTKLQPTVKFQSNFLDFIENINKVEQFESVFLLQSSLERYFDDNFLPGIGIPLILGTENSSFYLKGVFNENLLTIVQFDSSDLLYQRLLEYLQHLRFCKTIFVLKNSSRSDFELRKVFNFCWKNKMINVIAVFQDFWISSAYYIYSYTNFGRFNIEENIWNKKEETDVVFPNRMRDLCGIRLPVLFGGPEPGVIVSKNANGDTIFGGYMGQTIHSFAKKHNATLPNLTDKNLVTAYYIHDLVVNGTIEISGAFMIILRDSIQWFSYPYNQYDWGVMLPIEPEIPIYKDMRRRRWVGKSCEATQQHHEQQQQQDAFN
ncbi:uncharacterized protein LOC129918095 [Episyrphus balteatus]|uniref:uncharacterized protein LOC129918095 n=1 Tax=Episyrphus balteatus TaxID=286459 RepID=UPI002486C71D|nr:uncharacterized protein LOC129918095 [Episyrphus balteatus]